MKITENELRQIIRRTILSEARPRRLTAVELIFGSNPKLTALSEELVSALTSIDPAAMDAFMQLDIPGLMREKSRAYFAGSNDPKNYHPHRNILLPLYDLNYIDMVSAFVEAGFRTRRSPEAFAAALRKEMVDTFTGDVDGPEDKFGIRVGQGKIGEALKNAIKSLKILSREAPRAVKKGVTAAALAEKPEENIRGEEVTYGKFDGTGRGLEVTDASGDIMDVWIRETDAATLADDFMNLSQWVKGKKKLKLRGSKKAFWAHVDDVHGWPIEGEFSTIEVPLSQDGDVLSASLAKLATFIRANINNRITLSSD